MKPFIRMMILLVAGAMIAGSVACASGVASALPPASAPTASFVQSTPTPVMAASNQPKPAVQTTAAPSESQPVQSITITPQETPSRVVIKSLVLLSNWQMGITLEFGQPVEKDYYLKLDDTGIQYDCYPQLAYNHPERLFCTGRQPAMLKTISFALIDKTSKERVFRGSVYIPAR